MPSRPRRSLAAALILLLACGQADASVPSPAADLAPPAEPTFDLQAHIDERIAAGETHIVIAPGRYRVAPRRREHLRLEGLRDITLVADGVELVCTETTRAITIQDCHNLTLRGLVIDHDPLPYTQARILAVSPDTARLDVELVAGYPDFTVGAGSVEIFDPATLRLRGRITYFNTECVPAGPGRATLVRADSDPTRAVALPGDIAVIKHSHAPGGSLPHAIMATASTDLTLQHVTIHASNSFGFLENGCDGSRYLDCRVDRRPPDTDLVPRALPRLRSLNADAFHSKNARRGPRYERCVARFNGDDSIAINGDFHFVTQTDGPVLRVLAKFDQTLRVGDPVQLFTHDGRRLDNRTVVALAPDHPATHAERRLVADQRMNDRLQATAMKTGWRVTLDAPVEIPPGSLIASADSIGDGFAIRDCRLGFNRSRGILVKAGRGEIVDNEIEGSAMTAILVSPEFWWLEAGFADDLLIARNRIRDGGGIGIAILAHGGDGSLAPAGAFRNLTVRDNTIEGGPLPGILATSIRGLVEENNTIAPDPAKTLPP